MSTSTAGATHVRAVPGPALVLGAFLLTTGLNIASELGAIAFAGADPNAPEGPLESIVAIALLGGAALLITFAVAIPSAKDPARARIGAIILGVLALLSLIVFWSGAPASLGAGAAWLAGFGRGAAPQTGAARGFGVVGLVVVVLVLVVMTAGHVLVWTGNVA